MRIIRMIKRIGGEENNGRSRVELMPRSVRVTRSPRHAAIGGAMLSMQKDGMYECEQVTRARKLRMADQDRDRVFCRRR